MPDCGGNISRKIFAVLNCYNDNQTTPYRRVEDYDGGELVVEGTYGKHSMKLPTGDIYPGTSLHHVVPITRGSRTASFFWTQSLFRDDAPRALLFDLYMSIRRLSADHPALASVVSLTAAYYSLLRQWAEVSAFWAWLARQMTRCDARTAADEGDRTSLRTVTASLQNQT
jgi:predicted 2-oxoglutarate/Fe(II)-dependent dioxygenase YbiX